MAIKFPKEVSSYLFKYVSKIDIKFNRKYVLCCDAICGVLEPESSAFFHPPTASGLAFDGRTKSTREVFRQVQVERFKKSNPKV